MSNHNKKGNGKKRGHPWWLYAAGAFVLGGLAVAAFASRENSMRHPTPRSDVGAEVVVSPARYASYPRLAEVYRQASEVPAVLDGLYCYCNCSQHAGHYSLLDCFRNDHAARCDVCLAQAAMAYRLTLDGYELPSVRDAVDQSFQS